MSIMKNAATLKQLLANENIYLRYNIRMNRDEVKYPAHEWISLNKRERSTIRDFIWTDHPHIRYSRAEFDTAADVIVNKAKVDPFLLWLNSLPDWDKIPRIDTILIDYFGAEDTLLNRWASKYIFMGAVKRALCPGTKLDVMPILVDSQGIGKSTLLRHILPNPEWSGRRLNFEATEKEKMEATEGKVIVEAAELVVINPKHMENIKNYLTAEDDEGIRMAYAHNANFSPRTFIIIGTTNDQHILPNDPTGNRRFLPVELTRGCAVELLCDEFSDQWWAEALVRTKVGEDAAFPRQLTMQQSEINLLFKSRNERLEAKIQKLHWESRPCSIGAVAEALNVHDAPKVIAGVLRDLGWKHTRTKEGRFWTPPLNTENPF